MARLKGGKVDGVWNFSAEPFKAEGDAVICSLHAALVVIWQSGSNSS